MRKIATLLSLAIVALTVLWCTETTTAEADTRCSQLSQQEKPNPVTPGATQFDDAPTQPEVHAAPGF